MPYVPKELQGIAPVQPHLALLTDEHGGVTAIPPGATIFIIEDPTKLDRIFPMILAKVTRRSIHFICGCGKCRRTYVYTLSSAGGHHTQSEAKSRAALASVQRESRQVGATAPTAPSPKTGKR